MTVSALFHQAAFSPDITRSMGDAYDLACHLLQDTGQPEMVNEIIAKRIIESARRGVQDPQELCKEALAAFGGEGDAKAALPDVK